MRMKSEYVIMRVQSNKKKEKKRKIAAIYLCLKNAFRFPVIRVHLPIYPKEMPCGGG